MLTYKVSARVESGGKFGEVNEIPSFSPAHHRACRGSDRVAGCKGRRPVGRSHQWRDWRGCYTDCAPLSGRRYRRSTPSLRLSVELDAIYKRTGFSDGPFGSTCCRFSDQITANQWEFPLLAKYEILGGRIRPFIDAGPVLRHMSGFKDVFMIILASGSISGTFNNTPDLSNRNSPGFAAGGGVTFRILRMRISPEFRYTRWGSGAFQIAQFGPEAVSNANQEDLLVGFTF